MSEETRKLTPKQAAFVRAYLETGNASEAYRRAYNASNMKPEVIKVKASELLKNGNVAVTVERSVSALAKIGFSDIRKAIKCGSPHAHLTIPPRPPQASAIKSPSEAPKAGPVKRPLCKT